MIKDKHYKDKFSFMKEWKEYKYGDLFAESHRLETSIREKFAGIGFNVKEG